MTEFKYHAVQVLQRPDARPFYLMTATAEEILQWSDVPRKKSDYMAGYQRELDERHTRIRDFIQQDPSNIIPGAIIIAVAHDSINATPVKDKEGVYELAIRCKDRDTEELLRIAHANFLSRLSTEEQSAVDKKSAEQTPDENADEDTTPPPSYLAVLAQELGTAINDRASLGLERWKAVEEYVSGTAKPGLILDGQHRVFGAKEVQQYSVKLPIVLLPGLPTSEQVFHFYVLNNKAKPLTPTELRATVSTSLSNKEIEALYTRLHKSGIKADEARWTHKVNTDANSPFYRTVDFGFKDKSGFIPENVMFQVVSRFMKPAKKYRLLSDDLPSWHTGDEFRLSMFFAFWGAIKDKYPTAWKNGHGCQLFMKVSMLVLQEMLFDNLAKDMPKRMKRGARSPLADASDLREEIEGNLHFLPEDFFLKDWAMTGLDTPEGHTFLRKQMDEAINKQGEKLGTLPLFKAKKKT